MGGGGGNMLNKMIPGYKDKIWEKLPHEMKKKLIVRQHFKFEKELINQSVSSTRCVEKYNTTVASAFAPDYASRTPVVDYKRQFVRGTFLEGRDAYVPNNRMDRMLNLECPYTESEQEERRQQFSRYDLKFALAFLFGAFLIHDYKQSRPIAWCVNLDPAKPRYPWKQKNWMRSYDVKSVRRGFEVYRAVCSSCHSIRKAKWWFLMKDVYPVRRVQEFAAEKTMIDGLTNEGELNIRPCFTWDFFPRLYPTLEAAKEANNGKVPPDFSEGPYYYRGGADYMFSVLTGYRDPPVGLTLTSGTYYNPWFAGGVIGMPPPLEDGLVDFEDGTPATVSQMAKDVVHFLAFVADPQENERKLLIIKFLLGTVVAWPAAHVMRKYAMAGVWHRSIQFDKLRQI